MSEKHTTKAPAGRRRQARELASGDKGPAVKRLQARLTKEGFDLTIDGVFGNTTRGAVCRFQRDHGIRDDGVVGPVTWATLEDAAGWLRL
ncbi:MAG: peptidoglycan-binding domain-containing protein [Pseudomonadota bacterium]